ncbi:transcriptional regulator, IclR family protein [Halorubrum sp. Ib24]|uniref:IclR family transcriptional regulator n=1 Tax=Halorubrum sp. Ib24 TaxID=1383850 RepID=UPI000B98DA27|nr:MULTISPECIES: IclR family transcriptional regulator [unclassified Halorubrum]OYR42199.1 transcriptional regulator, IclR family protein [Halorubrum sp. Ib24]OYR54148.1 transcriptional regulator, IclR family protein [Halorubrum sp. Ea1]
MGDPDTISVQATATSLQIVEELYERNGAGVTELADAMDVSKSAVHNHLSTLCTLGYVKNIEGTYELTHRFLRIGFGTRERNTVYQAAQSEIRKLAQNTNAVANLVVPEEADAIYLHRIGNDDHPIAVGGSVRLHGAAAGKAILAFRSADAVDEYVNRYGLDRKTDRTVTDPATLRSELRSIRDRKIAFDRGELDANWQCVASPIVVNGDPVGAVTVSGPSDEMQGKRLEEDTAGLVSSAAKTIELELL